MIGLKAPIELPKALRTPRRIPRRPSVSGKAVIEKPSGDRSESAELSQKAAGLPTEDESAAALLSPRLPGPDRTPDRTFANAEPEPPPRNPFVPPPESEIATVPLPRPAADAPRKPPLPPTSVPSPAAKPTPPAAGVPATPRMIERPKDLMSFDLITCGSVLHLIERKTDQDVSDGVLYLETFLDQNASDPRDPFERMIIENIVALQQRTMRLHARCAGEQSLEKLKLLNTETERMSRELRAFIQLLHQHRAASRRGRSKHTELVSNADSQSGTIA